jgi:hypothetical protein
MQTVSAPPLSLVARAPRQPQRRRRSGRPLCIEFSDHLFFVTSRTRDSVFWLHPLLCSSLEPANHEARRVIDAKRARLDARPGCEQNAESKGACAEIAITLVRQYREMRCADLGLPHGEMLKRRATCTWKE